MGKKPVLGIVSALCVGLALTGCRNCTSCQSDNTKVTKTNPAAFKPQPTFQSNSAAAAPSAQGWNNSATTPKPTISAPVDTSTPLGMDKPAQSTDPLATSKPAQSTDPLATSKPAQSTDPLATSKPAQSTVQPTAFARPLGQAPAPMPAPTTTPTDEAAPVDSNTSHFAPTGAGRILPSPPTLAPTSSLSSLSDEHPAPRKTEDSSALPLPPPPPPPSMAPLPVNDAPALPKETPPSSLPAPSLEPGTLPPLPPPPAPPGPNG